jgi:hypothetical protein
MTMLCRICNHLAASERSGDGDHLAWDCPCWQLPVPRPPAFAALRRGMPRPGNFDKRSYQREYMRAYRMLKRTVKGGSPHLPSAARHPRSA